MVPGIDTLQPALLFATPLLVAAAGELLVERAGVVNIAIEGMMLAGALAAWIGNGYAGPAAGFLAAIAAAILLALLFALASILFAADQIVTGTGINLLAFGGIALAYKRISGSMAAKTITAINPTWMMLAVTILLAFTWFYLSLSRRGLELTAIGEA